MTKITFSILLAVVLFTLSCTTNQNKDSAVTTISGVIKNPRSGKIILSQEQDINKKQVKFIEEIKPDSGGKFKLDLKLEPHIYKINFYDQELVTLAIDKGQNILIEADGNTLKNIKVSGSEDTKKLEAYEKFRKESLERLVKSVRKKIKDAGQEFDPNAVEAGQEEIVNYEKHKDELNEFVAREMADSIAVYSTTLRWDGDKNISLFEEIAEKFEKKHGDIAVAKKIKEKIALLKATSIGGKAADIKMPNEKGEEIVLDPSKAKLTLVDFWASWCGPCRRESKTLSSLYEKYKSKGLEIYGVSLDDNREKWLQASEKDKRVWANVSTLKAFKTKAALDYSVTALPAKFLLDSEGKIVAKNLHGKELEQKVEELLK